jgi:hypothetical protein
MVALYPAVCSGAAGHSARLITPGAEAVISKSLQQQQEQVARPVLSRANGSDLIHSMSAMSAMSGHLHTS